MLYATLGEWFGGLCLLALLLLGERARARGGNPIRWRLVGLGAASMFGAILAVMLVLAGPGHLGLALELLAHRTLEGVDAAAAFRTGLALVPALVIGCALGGIVVVRANRGAARLESALAVIAIMVVPALAFGTLEGEQAGLVLAALAGIGTASLAGRLTARRYVTAETAPTPPTTPPKKKARKRR